MPWGWTDTRPAQPLGKGTLMSPSLCSVCLRGSIVPDGHPHTLGGTKPVVAQSAHLFIMLGQILSQWQVVATRPADGDALPSSLPLMGEVGAGRSLFWAQSRAGFLAGPRPSGQGRGLQLAECSLLLKGFG